MDQLLLEPQVPSSCFLSQTHAANPDHKPTDAFTKSTTQSLEIFESKIRSDAQVYYVFEGIFLPFVLL